jgi:hypothetical protein
MKTKLTLNKTEMRQLLIQIIPPEFFPQGATITNFEVTGYPIKEYEIYIETKEIAEEI